MSSNDYFESLLFIGQDTLNEIRENKKHQRDTTYQFVFIIVALFGLAEIFKNILNISISHLPFKIITIIYGCLTVYFLIRLQKTLAYFRKRISKIWAENSFKFAFDKEILVRKGNYFSFWNNFWGFTFMYILMVISVTLVIFFLL